MSDTTTGKNGDNGDAYNAILMVADSKANVPHALCGTIARVARDAIAARGAFTVALSGGSLPSLLALLPRTFESLQEDPHWDKWHVLLADERCVPSSHADSNLGSLRKEFLTQHTSIPASQIHGINESLLPPLETVDKYDGDAVKVSTTAAIASDYNTVVQRTLRTCSAGLLDLAVLGFGPDGHTCSLFPGHESMLSERTLWVAPVTDSPKPPPCRVTLTFGILNAHTRHVIVCGAGDSKGAVLEKVFQTLKTREGKKGESPSHDFNHTVVYDAKIQRDPAPFPCAMVDPRPTSDAETSAVPSLTWIVDQDAMKASHLRPNPLL